MASARSFSVSPISIYTLFGLSQAHMLAHRRGLRSECSVAVGLRTFPKILFCRYLRALHFSRLLNRSSSDAPTRVIAQTSTIATLVTGLLRTRLASSHVGCTTGRLRQRTFNQGATLPALHYQQVLDNFALFATHPGSPPWHVNLRGEPLESPTRFQGDRCG
jgi:hypothetical protein